ASPSGPVSTRVCFRLPQPNDKSATAADWRTPSFSAFTDSVPSVDIALFVYARASEPTSAGTFFGTINPVLSSTYSRGMSLLQQPIDINAQLISRALQFVDIAADFLQRGFEVADHDL